MTKTKLIRNRARCTVCETIVDAPIGNSLASCKCGKLSVGGRLDKPIRFGDGSLIEEMSEYSTETVYDRGVRDCGCGPKSD